MRPIETLVKHPVEMGAAGPSAVGNADFPVCRSATRGTAAEVGVCEAATEIVGVVVFDVVFLAAEKAHHLPGGLEWGADLRKGCRTFARDCAAVGVSLTVVGAVAVFYAVETGDRARKIRRIDAVVALVRDDTRLARHLRGTSVVVVFGARSGCDERGGNGNE